MLTNLFHRAVADLDNIDFVDGAVGSRDWRGASGCDTEGYSMVKNKDGKWDIKQRNGASNRDPVYETVATVEDIKAAATFLRTRCDYLKSRYAGFFNWLKGKEYMESDGDRSMAAVERALRQRTKAGSLNRQPSTAPQPRS